MKIGIFAGTFDPVHKGHVEFAARAISEAGLDKVVMVAEKEPYRKKPHVSWDHRQAMIERATEGLELIDHNYQFASQLAHQHTMINMLEVARHHYGSEHEFWFLVGSDVFEHMHKWHEVVENTAYGGFVVALRHDHTPAWLNEKLTTLKHQDFIPKVVVIPNYQGMVTSTEIRQAVQNHQETTNSATGVMSYIVEHNLYR